MTLICAILVRAAMQPRMRGNTIAVKENFNGAGSDPHIHLLLDILIRNGVILLFYGDMVVILDGCNFQDAISKGAAGKAEGTVFFPQTLLHGCLLSFERAYD